MIQIHILNDKQCKSRSDSWLLQKPTDLDLHCLQRQDISGFSRTRVKSEEYPQLVFKYHYILTEKKKKRKMPYLVLWSLPSSLSQCLLHYNISNTTMKGTNSLQLIIFCMMCLLYLPLNRGVKFYLSVGRAREISIIFFTFFFIFSI